MVEFVPGTAAEGESAVECESVPPEPASSPLGVVDVVLDCNGWTESGVHADAKQRVGEGDAEYHEIEPGVGVAFAMDAADCGQSDDVSEAVGSESVVVVVAETAAALMTQECGDTAVVGAGAVAAVAGAAAGNGDVVERRTDSGDAAARTSVSSSVVAGVVVPGNGRRPSPVKKASSLAMRSLTGADLTPALLGPRLTMGRCDQTPWSWPLLVPPSTSSVTQLRTGTKCLPVQERSVWSWPKLEKRSQACPWA